LILRIKKTNARISASYEWVWIIYPN